MDFPAMLKQFTAAVENADYEAFGDLFTEDGVWSNMELGHYEGREAIRSFFNGASEAIPFAPMSA